jgi:hypothetical protein
MFSQKTVRTQLFLFGSQRGDIFIVFVRAIDPLCHAHFRSTDAIEGDIKGSFVHIFDYTEQMVRSRHTALLLLFKLKTQK